MQRKPLLLFTILTHKSAEKAALVVHNNKKREYKEKTFLLYTMINHKSMRKPLTLFITINHMSAGKSLLLFTIIIHNKTEKACLVVIHTNKSKEYRESLSCCTH